MREWTLCIVSCAFSHSLATDQSPLPTLKCTLVGAGAPPCGIPHAPSCTDTSSPSIFTDKPPTDTGGVCRACGTSSVTIVERVCFESGL